MDVTKYLSRSIRPVCGSLPSRSCQRASPARFFTCAFSAFSPARQKQWPVRSLTRHSTCYPKPRPLPLQALRANSTASDGGRPLTDRPNQVKAEPTHRDVPSYELTFTCKPCLTRSKHKISKQGYQSGTVLISCPNCKNRHIISDHLKIFSDKSVTVEQLLAEKGEAVKKGVLGENGDLEFWDDGSTSSREEPSPKQEAAAALPIRGNTS